jgi:exosortase A-associated hydrolase 2
MELFFLAGSRGALFAVYHPPAAGMTSRSGVLCAPPFAEELNKSRRMIAQQARRLAAAGFGVLIPDLYGTGDSAGDFGDARWEIWREDLARCAEWLRQRGHESLILWGLRLGGLLAAELAAEGAATRLLLWQPVLSGQRFLHQFLRLRLTADRLKGGSETLGRLQEALAAGQSLDVAGYELHPELAAALDQVRLTLPLPGVQVDWFELTRAAEGSLAPASRRIVDEWRSAGVVVHARTVVGESFWATQEIAEAPDLLAETVAALFEGP